jgi:hypothetical protein
MTSNLYCEICDDFVLLAKKETVLQGMIDGVTEISICYGNRNECDKK